ncbi:MAG TPA: TVP38/TMEM64 family protein [Thermoanaerobaculia bacterium]|nr:TVP38/TMEM64 family protein [Thermoanaerobaculia bacterium]
MTLSVSSSGTRKATILRIVVALALLGGLFALFRFLPVGVWIDDFKAWVAGQGALGVVVFALAYVGVSLVPGGPAAVMTLAGGAVFGFWKGTIVISIASTCGATLAFLLARTVLRERAGRLAASSPRFAGLNRAIEKEGGKIVALVRLSPLFPFTVVNYLFGLTPVRPLSYVLASWLAMLPGTAAYVYFGAALGDAASGADPVQKAIKISLGVAAIVATVLIARFAAKAIRAAGVEAGEERAGDDRNGPGAGGGSS